MIGASTLLEVSTLGRFDLRRGREPLAGGNWSRRKVRDLFKLLLSAEQHRLHREQAQELLWPASTIEQAANSFGKTLYLLRRALQPDLAAGKGGASIYVLLDRDTLLLLPDNIQIDADIFEAAAKQLQVTLRNHSSQGQTLLDEFDQVLALYGGDFLPEDLYEDWATRRRDRLRRVYSSLLESAAELALTNAQGQRACEYLQALVERNSADEQTHRQLMLTYARMGRRSDALNQYQLLRDALREELSAKPLPETMELLRAIQAGRIAVDLDESRLASGQLTHATRAEIALHVHAHPDTDSHTEPEQAHAPVPVQAVDTVPSVPSAPSAPSAHEQQPAAEHETRQHVENAGNVGNIGDAGDEEDKPEAARQLNPDRILNAELVGREHEIELLQRAYQQAQNGQRRVCILSGEPGIGKSRLARELTAWGEETQQATVLWGYCYEMSGSLPYQPIADAISAHVRTCSPEQLRHLLGNSAVDLAKIAPEVRFKLPDLPLPEPLGPEAERRNLYSAVARYFNALAAERPLILILDDLQWADAATMQLLNFLTLQSAAASHFEAAGASKQKGVPFYILLYRADEVQESHPLRGLIASLSRSGIGEELRLQRLSEAEVRQLLMNMAGHDVRPVFASEIYRQTEGNPFFIGEAIRSLVLEGKIKYTGERWQATVSIEELGIPASVRLLIERRLVHFSPECRTTLSLAAVLGRQFSSTLLCDARMLSEDIVAEHIDEAIQSQIFSSLAETSAMVIPDEQGNNTEQQALYGQDVDLIFTHDKIREVLYQWLNPLRRRALHRQAAQAIEARYAARLQPYYSTLAYHYQMAEDAAQAIKYLQKATEVATSVYAFLNAATYLKTALDLLLSEDERQLRAELLKRLSGILLYTGRLDDAIKAGLAAAALWRDLGNTVKQAETYLDVSFLGHWQGRETESVKYIKQALECLASTPQEILLIAKAHAQWGLAATVMGEPVLAREKLRQAEALSKQVGEGDAFIPVVSLWAQSWCSYLVGTPAQMLDYALQGAEVCRSSNKPDWEPMMNYSASWACMLLGRIPEGVQLAREALKKAHQHGVVGAQGWANLALAFLAIQQGNWVEAKAFGESASAIASLLHDADLQARVLWNRSVCAGWEGDWSRAVEAIVQGLEMAKKEGEISMVYPHLLLQAARAYLYVNKPAEAQRYLNQARELALARQYRQLPAIAQRLQARIWQAQGWFDEAQICFERSLAALQELNDPVEYARSQQSYGQLYLERNLEGDAQKGQQLLDSARKTFQKLGVNG